METKKVYLDRKITIWERYFITVPVEMEGEEIAEKFENDEIEADSSEMMFDTSDLMMVEENGGCSTIEVFTDKGENIYSNGE